MNFFAGAAEAADADQLQVDGDLTVAELSDLLGTGNPALQAVLARSTLLVDGRAAPPDTAISASARVDVLPPFAGG